MPLDELTFLAPFTVSYSVFHGIVNNAHTHTHMKFVYSHRGALYSALAVSTLIVGQRPNHQKMKIVDKVKKNVSVYLRLARA